MPGSLLTSRMQNEEVEGATGTHEDSLLIMTGQHDLSKKESTIREIRTDRHGDPQASMPSSRRNHQTSRSFHTNKHGKPGSYYADQGTMHHQDAQSLYAANLDVVKLASRLNPSNINIRKMPGSPTSNEMSSRLGKTTTTGQDAFQDTQTRLEAREEGSLSKMSLLDFVNYYSSSFKKAQRNAQPMIIETQGAAAVATATQIMNRSGHRLGIGLASPSSSHRTSEHNPQNDSKKSTSRTKRVSKEEQRQLMRQLAKSKKKL